MSSLWSQTRDIVVLGQEIKHKRNDRPTRQGCRLWWLNTPTPDLEERNKRTETEQPKENFFLISHLAKQAVPQATRKRVNDVTDGRYRAGPSRANICKIERKRKTEIFNENEMEFKAKKGKGKTKGTQREGAQS